MAPGEQHITQTLLLFFMPPPPLKVKVKQRASRAGSFSCLGSEAVLFLLRLADPEWLREDGRSESLRFCRSEVQSKTAQPK